MDTLRSRQGFTLIEIMIVACIFGLITASVYGLMTSTTEVYDVGVVISSLEGRSRATMDLITDELQGAVAASLIPAAPSAPFGASTISFQKNVGYDGFNITWGDPTTIGFDGAGAVNKIYLSRPLAGVGWTNIARDVRDYLEGEDANGIDDNGNGLIDEEGLSFELNGSTLTIRLSLEIVDHNGRTHTATEETSVSFRN
jgi:prepilin-type N-terminal cleavage/methylation domain-containing protein